MKTNQLNKIMEQEIIPGIPDEQMNLMKENSKIHSELEKNHSAVKKERYCKRIIRNLVKIHNLSQNSHIVLGKIDRGALLDNFVNLYNIPQLKAVKIIDSTLPKHLESAEPRHLDDNGLQKLAEQKRKMNEIRWEEYVKTNTPMKTIEIKSNTEYFAKKRIIQEALKAFKEDSSLQKVHIVSFASESDADHDKPITFEKTIERESFTKAIDYKNINEQWDEIVSDPLLGVKSVVLSIFKSI